MEFTSTTNKNKKLLEFAAVIIPIAVFIFVKLLHLSYRFGDGNAYFYMAHAFLHGILPYKDFVYADPPAMLFLLAGISAIFKNPLVLQATPVIIEAGNALLLFALLRRRNEPLAAAAPLMYLFAFSTLATSDYVTGVQLTVLFILGALWIWSKKYPIASGIFWGLAILTKFYAIPAAIGFGIYILIESRRPKTPVLMRTKKTKFWHVVAGCAATLAVLLAPFFIIAPNKFLNDLIIHHLNRPAGINKLATLQYFFTQEWLLILVALAGIIIAGISYVRMHSGNRHATANSSADLTIPITPVTPDAASKDNLLFALPFAGIFIFLLFYKDLYYLYLQSLIPFFCIFAVIFFGILLRRYGKLFASIALCAYVAFLVASIFSYYSTTYAQGRFQNAEEIAAAFQSAPPHPLYGSHEVAPLIALLSNQQSFNNYIDTNTQNFSDGAYDLQNISGEAVRQGVYLLARITDLPQYGIADTGFEGYFDSAAFKAYCKPFLKFPSTSGQQDNIIGIYFCSINAPQP